MRLIIVLFFIWSSGVWAPLLTKGLSSFTLLKNTWNYAVVTFFRLIPWFTALYTLHTGIQAAWWWDMLDVDPTRLRKVWDRKFKLSGESIWMKVFLGFVHSIKCVETLDMWRVYGWPKVLLPESAAMTIWTCLRVFDQSPCGVCSNIKAWILTFKEEKQQVMKDRSRQER